MDADRSSHETWILPASHLGRCVHVHSQLGSTNTLALSLGHDPANHGLAIVAHEQTAGRGQYGRTWQAPPGSSVLLSVLLFPPAPLRRPVVLTAWAAVAVSELISEITGLPAKIKWPNDVYLREKKVCGILIEQRSAGGADQPPAIAVGIGLNVRQPAEFFEQAGLTIGASLGSISGKEFDHADVAKRLLHQLDDDYARLVDGDFVTLEDRWRRRLNLIGAAVRIEGLDASYVGRLLAVTMDSVMLDVGAARPRSFVPEAVRHIHRTEQ